jgi:hypothetical protein
MLRATKIESRNDIKGLYIEVLLTGKALKIQPKKVYLIQTEVWTPKRPPQFSVPLE